MFSQTDQDVHHAAYSARNATINRDGWMTQSLESSGALKNRSERSFVERMRRRIGESLIGVGERMTGTVTSHPPAPNEYGPAVSSAATR
jgi:hypothetical protein